MPKELTVANLTISSGQELTATTGEKTGAIRRSMDEEGAFRGFPPEGGEYSNGTEKGRPRNEEIFCMQRMMKLMITDNRRRDTLLSDSVERFTPTSPVTTEPEQTFHDVPGLSNMIKYFVGDKAAERAKSWLENRNVHKIE